MLNIQIVVGRLGGDPEMRYTANGKATTSFSVAADAGFGDSKRTEWFRVVTWDKTAEACAQYLAKGSLVAIVGRTETRSWDGSDGVKKYRTELIAERVQFLDSKGDRAAAGGSVGADSDGDIDPSELPF